MNNLIEKIDKIIGKKGSVKAPAYFIRGLLIDIVKYFGNKINSLINDIKNINKVVKYTPTGVIYAGYSDGPVGIKDIYADHYILSEDPNYCSFAVLYSTKKITKITIKRAGANYDANFSSDNGNGLYVYRVELKEIAEMTNGTFNGVYSMSVIYVDGTEETINTGLVIIDSDTVRGKITLNVNGISKYIYIFGNNLTEFSINVPNGTRTIETSSDISLYKCKFIFLLNNHEIPTEYIKETENDKIVCKLIKS